MVEITFEEQKKWKEWEKEESIRDHWDNIKCTNIQIIGVLEEEVKKKRYEKMFEEIIVEIFPNMEKKIASQVQEAQRVSAERSAVKLMGFPCMLFVASPLLLLIFFHCV